jgi:DNA polymerase I-like protein with 3'-5' exonuclease and polymerase domains
MIGERNMKRKVLLSLSEVKDFFSDFNVGEYSFDTETLPSTSHPKSALRYSEQVISGISFCDGVSACYIPLTDDNRLEVLDWLGDNVFSTGTKGRGKKIVCQNIPFDAGVLHKYGIDFSLAKWFDTKVASHLLDENSPNGLKWMVENILGREVAHFNPHLSHYCQEFYEYGLDDAVNTWDLYQYFLPLLFEQGLDYLFFDIEMPFQRVLLEMRVNGVLVDVDKLNEQREILKKDRIDLLIKLHEALNIKFDVVKNIYGESIDVVSSLNLNSSQQLAKVLFEDLGLEVVETTPSGQPKTGKITLAKYADVPFVKLLSEYKGCEKLLTSFVEPLYGHIEVDGYTRPDFNDTGTRTGRLSCREPNLQQLADPKKAAYKKINHRECYVAPKGYLMFSADYSGQEVAVMAQQSKDPTLVESLRNGYDMHLAIANKFYDLGIPAECLVSTHPDYESFKDKFKKERGMAKTITFGLAYGKGAFGFSKDFGISEDEAQKIVDDYFSGMPKLKESIDATHSEVKRKGVVSNLAGRKRHFAKNENGYYANASLRQAFNFCIPETNKVYDKELGYVEIGTLSGVRTLWDGTSWSTGKIVKTGMKKIVNINLVNGQRLQCSQDHKIRVVNTYGTESWKTPAEFSKQQYVKLTDEIPHTLHYKKLPVYKPRKFKLQRWQEKKQVHNFIDNSFEDIVNSYDRGLVLGRLASDGYYTEQGTLGWLVAEHEEEILPELLRILKPFNPSVRDVTKSGFKRMTVINIYSKALSYQLWYLDIKNSMNNYFTQNKDLLRGYLKGFFDGDGGITGESIVLTFGKRHNNTKLPLEIQEGLQLLGIRSRVGFYTHSVRLRIRSSDINNFKTEVGFLKLKKQNNIPTSNRKNISIGRNYKVKSIEFTNEVIGMVDFINSTTGRFMTDGVVVHNCIQGFSADMIRAAMVNVWNRKRSFPEWDLQTIMQIHDESVYIVKEEHILDAKEMVKKAFEDVCVKFIVPVHCSIEVGTDYGNSK